MRGRHNSEATKRFEDRRERERQSPRLHERVPELLTLRLDIVEGRGLTTEDPKHSRIIMVDTAPALFTLKCSDLSCRDGGYELTNTMMRRLLANESSFDIEDTCNGSIGSASCGRSTRVHVTATYRE